MAIILNSKIKRKIKIRNHEYLLFLLLLVFFNTAPITLHAAQAITPPANSSTAASTTDNIVDTTINDNLAEMESIDVIFDAPWYQVEIILLTYNRSNSNEKWDQSLHLEQYPETFITIDHPYADKFKALDKKDSAGRKKLEQEHIQELDSIWIDNDKLFGAYQTLPKSMWLLNSLSRTLNKSSRYSVLYHQSWVQPLQNKEVAVPLLIQAGDQYDSFHELEGTVKLSVARYIHIDSNLWLRQFSDFQPLSEYSIHPISGNIYSEHQSNVEISIPLSDFQQKKQHFVWSKKPIFTREEGTYIIKNQLHINESRKMKSEELHYLDHPLFGLLIKLVPFDHPESSRKKMLMELNETVE